MTDLEKILIKTKFQMGQELTKDEQLRMLMYPNKKDITINILKAQYGKDNNEIIK